MQTPARIWYGGRTGAPIALIVATASVTLMFVATPFLISPIAERYGVSEGSVGAISVAQVGAFAAANFILPRLVRPSGRILRAAALALVILDVASVVPSWYPALIVLRLLAGAAAGTITWLAWTNAMKRNSSMAAVSATGPVAGLLGSPLIAALSTQGDRVVYAALALLTIPAVVFFAPVTGRKRTRGVTSGSRSNRVLLVALGALTMFGSALFINETIVARDIHGLTPIAISMGYSLNAAGGFVGARFATRHRHPGWFAASIAPAAALTVFGPTFLLFPAMAYWGFAFWMSVPGVLQMLVDRSLQPAERAGDGQGVMATGRAIGPAIGGGFVDAGHVSALAVTSAVGMAIAGLSIVGVKQGRQALPPTDPRTIDQR